MNQLAGVIGAAAEVQFFCTRRLEGVLVRQFGKLDLAHVRGELPALLELKDDALGFAKFEKLAATVAERFRT